MMKYTNPTWAEERMLKAKFKGKAKTLLSRYDTPRQGRDAEDEIAELSRVASRQMQNQENTGRSSTLLSTGMDIGMPADRRPMQSEALKRMEGDSIYKKVMQQKSAEIEKLKKQMTKKGVGSYKDFRDAGLPYEDEKKKAKKMRRDAFGTGRTPVPVGTITGKGGVAW